VGGQKLLNSPNLLDINICKKSFLLWISYHNGQPHSFNCFQKYMHRPRW